MLRLAVGEGVVASWLAMPLTGVLLPTKPRGLPAALGGVPALPVRAPTERVTEPGAGGRVEGEARAAAGAPGLGMREVLARRGFGVRAAPALRGGVDRLKDAEVAVGLW